MPRLPEFVLGWSVDKRVYELSTHGHLVETFDLLDTVAWQVWLETATTFAFRGARGRLTLCHEARPRGGRYWYGYHAGDGRARKRYLGPTARLSLARLEEVAAALAGTPGVEPGPPGERAPGPAVDPVAILVLPATKLVPPQPPPAQVERAGLLAALDVASALPLTLVVAPAGWGKTTAIAAWARRHPARIAWLALEATDDDPARFWSAVVAALRARLPGVGATALALLRASQPPPFSVVVTTLINELVEAGRVAPLTLVLDDCQLIADPAILESVDFLLAHLPAGLRLLIASRADPDLPLARLRARGQLAELRADSLRFSLEDTAAFLRGALDIPLAADDIAALATRTEGWAAGVQLVALALRGQPDHAAWLADFTGGHHYLLDYVDEEIVARQSPAVRRFLLRVSVLPRLEANLCAAVTGEAASGAILRELARQNLFLVPLDTRREWYRLHDLFREALLTLAAGEPGLLTEAHRRAAEWHAAHGDGRAAIGHALAAADYPLAADLIAREAPGLWLSGEARTVLGWLQALPDDALLPHARLALDAALRLSTALHAVADTAFVGARRDLEQVLARVEAGLGARADPVVPDDEAALLRRRLRLLRAWAEAQTLFPSGDAARLAPLAEECQLLSAAEEARWRVAGLAPAFWLAFTFRGDGRALLPQLVEAHERALAAGDHRAVLSTTVWLAHAYRDTGQLHAAERTGLAGLALAERLDMRGTSSGYLYLYVAEAYYAWDRLAEATDAVRALLAIARTWQQRDLLMSGSAWLALLALASGDLAAADRALREAEDAVQRERYAYAAPYVAAMRARYWLAVGDLGRAEHCAVPVVLDAHAHPASQGDAILALVCVMLAQRRYAEALATLQQFGDRLDRPGNLPSTVEFLALSVAALHHAGEPARTRTVAARLFALTEPEGWLRPYLDGGAPLEQALAALLAEPDDEASVAPVLPRAYIARLLEAFAAELRGRQGAGTGLPAPIPPGATSLVEPLTRREREVLAHLADGASNQEIADTLALSVHTVKRHVGGLLGKLGAASRTAAVARARAAHLL